MNMKTLLLLTAITATTLLCAGLAIAGDYHSGLSAVCSDCHTMHFSRGHDMDGGGGNENWQLGAGGPNHFLLKAPANELCLACHDGQAMAPDVLGASANGYDRAAGALNDNAGLAAGYETWMGHTLGSTAVAPGGTWSSEHGLECINCHTQHGRSGYKDTLGNTTTSAYRNLMWNDGTQSRNLSYSYGATVDTTKDIWEKTNTGVTADHYGQDNVQLLEPVATRSGMAEFCKSCHTNFHGATGGAEVGGVGAPGSEWLRHPNADSNIGAVGGGHSRLTQFNSRTYRVRVMSASGTWGTQGTAWTTAPADLTPTCVSCHKSHGSSKAFGLILPTGTAPMGEDGDSDDSKAICKQCHGQGAI